MRRGAFDFFNKPVQMERFLAVAGFDDVAVADPLEHLHHDAAHGGRVIDDALLAKLSESLVALLESEEDAELPKIQVKEGTYDPDASFNRSEASA